MAESLCNPFFSLLFTPAKAISKFKAVTDSDEMGMITECSKILRVNQSTSHYVMQWHITLQAFRSVLATASGSLLS